MTNAEIVRDLTRGVHSNLGMVGMRAHAEVRVRVDWSKLKVSKGAKIRNRYNQVPHLTQDTNGKVTNSQLDFTNGSQEVSPFPAGDHKAHMNKRVFLINYCYAYM